MLFKRIPLGNKLRNVAYLIGDKADGELAVIDMGYACDLVADPVRRLGRRLTYLLATHGHQDHIGRSGAISATKREFGAQLAAYKTAPALEPGDLRLDDGDVLTVGDLCVKVLHTPGHTGDSVCFLVNDTVLFTGDTLYVGRAPKGQRPRELFESLHHRVLSLPGDTRVWPGHDLGDRPSSTIACEKASNSVCLMNYEDFRDRRWDGKQWTT